MPVLLNGTLYDPEDVKRFDGQALHFVPAANREYLLAVDDIDLMVHWWRLLRWASLEDYKYVALRIGQARGPARRWVRHSARRCRAAGP